MIRFAATDSCADGMNGSADMVSFFWKQNVGRTIWLLQQIGRSQIFFQKAYRLNDKNLHTGTDIMASAAATDTIRRE